ncbi:uncharacterized protein LOC126671737 [Mercurialis annua]|uniref:uncharacterized protein LOC126671737 n=1 Tax=Mercurialis annua TaxID=3986 RepID=UPI0024AFA3A5|nr:uncharacterized protein LOC126671737 [Mercurialis annua]
MVATNNLAFIGLVESKKEIVDYFVVKKIWPNLDFSFDWVPSIGASGGLLLIWNTILLNNISVSKGARWICLDFVHNNAYNRHILIYASNLASERLLLWHELSLLAAGEDFNETMTPEERWNGSDYTASMLALRDFVNNSELLNLPLHGRLFTWQNSVSKSRIDRCLVSAIAGTLWPDMSLIALLNGQSDHISICFRSANGFDWGPKPFRSVDAWWDHSEFADFVKNSWDVACGNSTNLIQRLKDIRQTIKCWNSEVFGDQKKIIQDLSQKIQEKDLATESRILSEAEKRIESLWIQKFRVKWNLEGDKNTKFFHSIASSHYRNNYISSVVVDGTIFSEPKDIRLHIREFYSKLYSLQADALVKSFQEAEIFNALCSCAVKKEPGPDGFNFYFYRKAWPVMKNAIMELFLNFHRFNILPGGINSSFMVLTPKVAGSTNIKDYCPISLFNGIYKLLSKVLSQRLAPMLSSVISDNQHAFLKGRSILECSMIANELIHIATRRKEKLLVLKLDFHKAFDNINWEYLFSIMRCMNFSAKWIEWISCGLSTTTTAVLVNGSPVDPIPLKRGRSLGSLRGFLSEDHDPSSLLQFADDTILYLPYDIEQLRNLTRFIHCFELISRLTINYHKSFIMGINVPEAGLLIAAQVVGCKIDFFPVKYLGLPLSNRKLYARSWNSVVERFKSRMALWKGSLLSPAGRLVLIKSVLFSIPVYFMSLFRMPGSVQNQLESYMIRFLWKGDISSRVLSKVSWKVICNDFQSGGLGFHNLKIRNQSLLFKWVWKVRINNRASLWFNIASTCSNVVDWNSLLNGDVKRMSFIWKGIKKACCDDKRAWGVLISNLNYNVGEGTSISLWNDNWSGISTASILFPRFYKLSNQKQSTISVIWREGWCWRRRLRNDKLLLYNNLLSLFNMISCRVGQVDIVSWNGKSGLYTPSSFYRALTAFINLEGGVQAAGYSFEAATVNRNSTVNVLSISGRHFLATGVVSAVPAASDRNSSTVSAVQLRHAAVSVRNSPAVVSGQNSPAAFDLKIQPAAALMEAVAAVPGRADVPVAAFMEDVAFVPDPADVIESSNHSSSVAAGPSNFITEERRVEAAASEVTVNMFLEVWKSKAPPRVKFFIWLALHNRVPSLEFLSRRSIITIDNSLCILCGLVETQDHIFIHCSFARGIWCDILQKFDVVWTFPSTFVLFYGTMAVYYS